MLKRLTSCFYYYYLPINHSGCLRFILLNVLPCFILIYVKPHEFKLCGFSARWWQSFLCSRGSITCFAGRGSDPGIGASSRDSTRRALLRLDVVWSRRNIGLDCIPKRGGVPVRFQSNKRGQQVSHISVPVPVSVQCYIRLLVSS